jgi:hypothetical protein
VLVLIIIIIITIIITIIFIIIITITITVTTITDKDYVSTFLTLNISLPLLIILSHLNKQSTNKIQTKNTSAAREMADLPEPQDQTRGLPDTRYTLLLDCCYTVVTLLSQQIDRARVRRREHRAMTRD